MSAARIPAPSEAERWAWAARAADRAAALGPRPASRAVVRAASLSPLLTVAALLLALGLVLGRAPRSAQLIAAIVLTTAAVVLLALALVDLVRRRTGTRTGDSVFQPLDHAQRRRLRRAIVLPHPPRPEDPRLRALRRPAALQLQHGLVRQLVLLSLIGANTAAQLSEGIRFSSLWAAVLAVLALATLVAAALGVSELLRVTAFLARSETEGEPSPS